MQKLKFTLFYARICTDWFKKQEIVIIVKNYKDLPLTIAEEIAENQEWLTLLLATRKDMGESGLTKRIEKGNFSATFHSVLEVQNEIRSTKSKIMILERCMY